MKYSALEKDIEETILDFLFTQKIYAWKNPTSGFYDTKTNAFRTHNSDYAIRGSSDILGVLPEGIFLAIEVKTPARIDNVSMDQKLFIQNIVDNGGVAFVSVSLEDCIKQFDKFGYFFDCIY